MNNRLGNLVFLLLLLLVTGCAALPAVNKQNNQTAPVVTLEPTLTPPLNRVVERLTKKPFGIKISPTDSPVSPERFAGYHTGADLEILKEETDADVVVATACDGKLLLKKYASGYGGVAVQSCQLNNQPVTIIYGHLKLDSITAAVGDTLPAGRPLGILGQGYSSQTDGERKHLHFGIHQGSAVNSLGYVATASALSDWLNPAEYLK